MSCYAERYGIPAAEVQKLSGRFKKHKMREGFGCFDNFLKFCAEVGYQPGMMMGKCEQDIPHGPENTFFYKKGTEGRIPERNTEKNANRICSGCEKAPCTASGSGCPTYRKAWTENWNKNIHRKTKQDEDDPKTRKYFRYEYPDLVREGIIWMGNQAQCNGVKREREADAV